MLYTLDIELDFYTTLKQALDMVHTPTNLAQCLGAGGFMELVISNPCPDI